MLKVERSNTWQYTIRTVHTYIRTVHVQSYRMVVVESLITQELESYSPDHASSHLPQPISYAVEATVSIVKFYACEKIIRALNFEL